MRTGQLSDEPTADLLRRLATEGATGCLRLHAADESEARIYLREGLVYTADAPSVRARLGDRLVGAEELTEAQLSDVLAEQRRLPDAPRIGEMLVRRGAIDRETMRRYVREQITDSVTTALAWTAGRYEFSAGEQTEEDVPLDLSVENLLMEGARRLSELGTVFARIGSVDAVIDFDDTSDPAELALTPDEWAMLTRIDGSSSIAEIAHDAGYSEVEAARLIYGLITAGVVTVIDEGPAAGEAMDELHELHESQASPATPVGAGLADLDLDALGLGGLFDDVEEDTDDDEDAEPRPPVRPSPYGMGADRHALLAELSALDGEDEDSTLPSPTDPAPPPSPRKRTEPPPEPKRKGLFGRRKR